MAESMKGLKRTHRCTELSLDNVGEEVTVMGWVQKNRNKGGIIFVDLRDRSGILQIIFEQGEDLSRAVDGENFEKAESLRSEYVIAVVGKVEKREGNANANMKTGDIEIRATQLRILSESETPPFPIEINSKTKEELRLKYRYLDLRRPDLQEKIIMRSHVTAKIREFMTKEGFLEIETPILNKSTPEGARDYLVPSRVHPGSFYALPQSPQLFKQLLMLAFPSPDHRRQKLDFRLFRQAQNMVYHLIDCLFFDLPSALGTMWNPDSGIEQTEIVIDFRYRADRRPGVSVCRFLVDGNRGRKSFDFLHIGFFHLTQKLSGIRRERLHIPPLPFRINCIECQRRFTGTAESC